MSFVNRRRVPAVLAGVVAGTGALALAAEATTQDLRAQVQALQAKVEALEAKSVTAADVDATVKRVLADADARSQLLPPGALTAGYNNGRFVIQSSDGKFLLNPQLQFQTRYVANWTKGEGGSNDENEDGFEIRRLKFGFGGNAWSPDLTYQFVWGTDRKSGTPKLEDAWVRYSLSPSWWVFGGQFKDFWTHEATVGSKRTLAAEASLLNQLLGEGQTDYVQGLGGGWEGERLRASIALHDGAKSANTNFEDYATDATTGKTTGSNFGTSIRGEWLAVGDKWKPYDDFSALGNKTDLLVFGAGADLTEAGSDNIIYHTVDAQWEPLAVRGLSLYGALVGRQTDREDSTYDYGALAQVGYLLNQKWEVFGRYDVTRFDDAGDAKHDTFHELTAGVNYYVNGHNAKLTLDLTYLPNGAPAKTDGLGFVESNEAEAVARVQFQLLQ